MQENIYEQERSITGAALSEHHSVSATKSSSNSVLGEYRSFIDQVRDTRRKTTLSGQFDVEMVKHLLNGGASEALEQHVPRNIRSRYGMFFSGFDISLLVARRLKGRLNEGATLADPACGAGNLLLACLDEFPLGDSLPQTLDAWGASIAGLDIHPELAAVTRERIALLAATRLVLQKRELGDHVDDLLGRFPAVREGDYLLNPAVTANIDCIVMNPPFVEVDTPTGCEWSSGKVQQAAVFVDIVLQNAKAGQEIVAILPDVLRSGTRYERWRRLIATSSEIVALDLYGRFDAKTDVDVFVLHIRKRQEPFANIGQWQAFSVQKPSSTTSQRLGDNVDVSVGAVVPHRHKKGQWQLYLDVSGARPHSEITVIRKRRFSGRLHRGPFVVIRRTSSPSDKIRALPAIVTNDDDIAVENHLIVLRPTDGSIETCRLLASKLCDTSVNDWLNREIRCRHLTTRVIKDLPIPGGL